MKLKDKKFDDKKKNQSKMIIKKKLDEIIDVLHKYS